MSEEQHDAVNGVAIAEGDIAALDTFSVESTMEVRALSGEILRHADGRAFTITFVSRDSPEFVQLARQQQDRRSTQAMRTRQPTSAAMQEADIIDLLVAVTRKWDIVLEGKPVESKPEHFRAVYKRYPRLREQADEYVGNAANFTKG